MRAGSGGHQTLQIDSDPNAESFYLRMGAVPVGTIDAPMMGTARSLTGFSLAVELS
ncbi:MAG: hypothetical protein ABI718_05485 [Acidobacteriota bacterium]